MGWRYPCVPTERSVQCDLRLPHWFLVRIGQQRSVDKWQQQFNGGGTVTHVRRAAHSEARTRKNKINGKRTGQAAIWVQCAPPATSSVCLIRDGERVHFLRVIEHKKLVHA